MLVNEPEFQNIFFFTFSGTFVYICDFHREQCWTRWVSKLDNGVSNRKEKVLHLLRQCAHACTPEEFFQELEALQNSEEWCANARLRTWFSKAWVPQYKVTFYMKIYYTG